MVLNFGVLSFERKKEKKKRTDNVIYWKCAMIGFPSNVSLPLFFQISCFLLDANCSMGNHFKPTKCSVGEKTFWQARELIQKHWKYQRQQLLALFFTWSLKLWFSNTRHAQTSTFQVITITFCNTRLTVSQTMKQLKLSGSKEKVQA